MLDRIWGMVMDYVDRRFHPMVERSDWAEYIQDIEDDLYYLAQKIEDSIKEKEEEKNENL